MTNYFCHYINPQLLQINSTLFNILTSVPISLQPLIFTYAVKHIVMKINLIVDRLTPIHL